MLYTVESAKETPTHSHVATHDFIIIFQYQCFALHLHRNVFILLGGGVGIEVKWCFCLCRSVPSHRRSSSLRRPPTPRCRFARLAPKAGSRVLPYWHVVSNTIFFFQMTESDVIRNPRIRALVTILGRRRNSLRRRRSCSVMTGLDP